MNIQGNWIWSGEELLDRNAYVSFRRRFEYCDGSAKLHITADSRYTLWVNGEYVGQGPVRAWPNHWRYDTYDIEPHLLRGENVIAVLVNHFGEGSMQYIPGPPGLLAQLELADAVVGTDSRWLSRPCAAYAVKAPRISQQQGFEEQYDARLDDGWIGCGYDDREWRAAAEVRPAPDGIHNNMEPRDIPFLTLEPVAPKRVVAKDIVRPMPHRFTVNIQSHLASGDTSCNMVFRHAYLATRIWAPGDVGISFLNPNEHPLSYKVNGHLVEGGVARLHAGWNNAVIKLGTWGALLEFVFCVDGPSDLVFSCRGEVSSSPWALVGPFDLHAKEWDEARNFMDRCPIVAEPTDESATCEAGDEFWQEGNVAFVQDVSYFIELDNEHILLDNNVYAQAYSDQVVKGKVRIDQEESLVSGNGWTTVFPDSNGGDIRILLDFGDELLALHSFEVIAPEGTIIDFHNFEFIQPDGRRNLAEGMNNSFRYICSKGRHAYQTLIHRGFRYSYVILRKMTGPVKIGRLQAIFHSYPQSKRGDFVCSDSKLNQIWRVGAQTLRCCSEDTYTDCPSYEQVLWVGDARNEALIDWVINGDPRLWYRFLELTGQSLERFPITQSQVPSSWDNIIPAWSMLWMRSCAEYLTYTGDRERSMQLLDFIKRNVDGIVSHINEKGLFDIHAWSLFDWAEMDTPPKGVITHQNCFAVLALREVALMAQRLEQHSLADKWTRLADSIAEAINIYLWNDEMRAYTDCSRDGKHSAVYSQQTQTAAYVSRVATGDRAERCREIMQNVPNGFVKAGSPFFEFFLLEAYQMDGMEDELLDVIRRDWGFMIDMGATTFWEMWSGREGRLTRSHCHAWSAAPTYFMSTYVLGIRPVEPGFEVVMIEPHPSDLKWCRGTVPTPAGDITVHWKNESSEPFTMEIWAPSQLQVRIILPWDGVATLNGERVACEDRRNRDSKCLALGSTV
ncbi:MAG: family 78 glycoside hydrolase catalytic domain [Armatimonadota bacterium]